MTKEEIVKAFRMCSANVNGDVLCKGCPFAGKDDEADWCYDKLNREVLRVLEEKA